MRYLVSLSLLLLVVSSALAQSPLSTNQTKAINAINQHCWSPDAWRIISPSASLDDGIDRLFSPARDETQPACLKMRSYYVEREAKHSDVTHPIGYSTCTPSTRFDIKLAEDDPRK
jgi:hypothetical protein